MCEDRSVSDQNSAASSASPGAPIDTPAGARPDGAGSLARPRVTLFGRVGCHLCEDARSVIERVCAELGESFTEVDIDSDPALVEKYGAEIPVTLVDGRQHDFWRVSEDRLRAALLA
jgi:glutaredoxin